ncbi:MAG: FecR domain-containing protein [Methylotenera sp.]|nr:FecR domain-containing protein [Methylotenera sp.]
MNKIAWCCAVVLMSISSISIAANCNVGKVTAVHGMAVVERNGQSFEAGTDVLVCNGDKYQTDSTSVMELTLRDGSIITVGKDSVFTVSTYHIYKNKPSVALFELTKGAFRAVTGFMTKRPHRYEVKTATATIGVRGTDFWGGYGLTENGFDVVMLSGKGVYVAGVNGETVELNAEGLGTTVINQAAPTAPKKWGDEKVAKAVATITP